MRNTVKYSKLIATSWLVISCATFGQSSVGPNYEDILNGFSDPTRWLTYSGDYSGDAIVRLLRLLRIILETFAQFGLFSLEPLLVAVVGRALLCWMMAFSM